MRPLYAAWDLSRLNLLPAKWQESIAEVVSTSGIATVLDGRSSTSREPTDVEPMTVVVVTGDCIRQRLPWLTSLYEHQLRGCAERYFGSSLQVAEDVPSAVNINCLRGDGARYERHVDTNPCTGLLFVSSLSADQGGELVFETGQDQVAIRPTAGVFIAFDARAITHWVNPLRGKVSRISVPMNYYQVGSTQARPSDLNQYLYEREDAE